jgi:hypothetical protein
MQYELGSQSRRDADLGYSDFRELGCSTLFYEVNTINHLYVVWIVWKLIPIEYEIGRLLAYKNYLQ